MSNGLPNSKPTTKAEQTEKRRSNTLQREAMYESRLKALSEEIDDLRGIISRQQVDFDEMFRKSEAMRNRQVDVINRLLKGETISEELSIALEELGGQVILVDRLKTTIADLEAQVATLKKKEQPA